MKIQADTPQRIGFFTKGIAMTELTEPCGVLLIDKPAGMTSHDVVGKVRRLYNTRKVGHTGTLDPLATGVLVILIGRAVKATEYLSTHQKTYIATLRLGLTTDTEDVTGEVLTTTDQRPSPEEVVRVAESFSGEIEQIPPMYSALKVGGKKLVDLARRGVEVERKARPVTVHSMKCEPIGGDDYSLTVTCSAGTYIRTLCADIGKALGCGGVMATLRRAETGGFSLADCQTIAALEEMEPEERRDLLIPIEPLFADLDAVKLPAFYEKLCRSGCEIYQAKIRDTHPLGARVRLCGADGSFFALGEVQEFEKGTAIKAIKHFDV